MYASLNMAIPDPLYVRQGYPCSGFPSIKCGGGLSHASFLVKKDLTLKATIT